MMDAPPETPVRISFQLTQDEFAEATGQAKGKRRNWLGLLGWLALIAVVLASVRLLQSNTDDDIVFAERPFVTRLLLALGPGLLVSALGVWAAMRAGFGPRIVPWEPPPGMTADGKRKPSLAANLVGVAVGLGIAGATFLFNRNPDPFAPNYAPLLTDSSLYLPIIAVTVAIFPTLIAFVQMQPRMSRRAWEAQHNLREPQTFDADDAGLRLVTTASRSEYEWRYFAGFRETENLLLLYPSPLLIHIIPKRAFATEDDFHRFCGLLQTHVKAGTFLPKDGSFAVASVAALPVATPAERR